MIITLVVSSILSPAVAPAFQAPKAITSEEILGRIANEGASHAAESLFNSAEWEPILQGIAGGEEGWLQVAASLKPAADGHASEELNCAISEALAQNPAGVLALVRDGPFEVVDACGWLGFYTYAAVPIPRAELLVFLERRRAAVESLEADDLLEIRKGCLAELDRTEEEVKRTYGL